MPSLNDSLSCPFRGAPHILRAGLEPRACRRVREGSRAGRGHRTEHEPGPRQVPGFWWPFSVHQSEEAWPGRRLVVATGGFVADTPGVKSGSTPNPLHSVAHRSQRPEVSKSVTGPCSLWRFSGRTLLCLSLSRGHRRPWAGGCIVPRLPPTANTFHSRGRTSVRVFPLSVSYEDTCHRMWGPSQSRMTSSHDPYLNHSSKDLDSK